MKNYSKPNLEIKNIETNNIASTLTDWLEAKDTIDVSITTYYVESV